MNEGQTLTGNLIVILIALGSLVPLVAIVIFIAYRMRHGSDRERKSPEASREDSP